MTNQLLQNVTRPYKELYDVTVYVRWRFTVRLSKVSDTFEARSRCIWIVCARQVDLS